MNTTLFTGLGLVLLTTIGAHGVVVVDDTDGALGAARAPVTVNVKLSRSQRRAAREGRLQLRELEPAASFAGLAVPVQILGPEADKATARLCWLMPPGTKASRRFELQTVRRSPGAQVVAKQDVASGQFDISEGGKPVLRYNYATIEPGELLDKVAPGNRIYTRARSDYIHPLFGLDGEQLTYDWPIDHPHHRGIYWAWPEVDWRGQRGDLHALQFVFARPTGKCSAASGPVFAQIEAENIWKWEDKESLVHERAIIRAYRTTGDQRLIDLQFQFTALSEPVLLARRGTDKYGGLNLRLAKVIEQEIAFHTDASNASPRMAWAELNGRFGEAGRTTGLVVFQHNANSDYPGDWVKFPEINWFQPTFPASGTRYELKKGEPLVLRFRLWLHRGAKASVENCMMQWRAFQAAVAPSGFSTP
jgi:hypothetical protein